MLDKLLDGSLMLHLQGHDRRIEGPKSRLNLLGQMRVRVLAFGIHHVTSQAGAHETQAYYTNPAILSNAGHAGASAIWRFGSGSEWGILRADLSVA